MNNDQPTKNSNKPDGCGHCAPATGYADSIRRWNFENRGGEIWVCDGDHDKCESCVTHSREVFAAEAIRIIEKLRAEALALHNNEVTHG